MVVFFAITISVLLALSSVAAEPILTPALFSRQISSDAPTNCRENQCMPLYDAVAAAYQNNCSGKDCYCSNDIAKKAKTCAQCIIDASSNATTVENDFDAYLKGCAASGHPISGVSPYNGDTKGNGGAIVRMSTTILGVVIAIAVGSVAFV